jgi:hypothetical protein
MVFQGRLSTSEERLDGSEGEDTLDREDELPQYIPHPQVLQQVSTNHPTLPIPRLAAISAYLLPIPSTYCGTRPPIPVCRSNQYWCWQLVFGPSTSIFTP